MNTRTRYSKELFNDLFKFVLPFWGFAVAILTVGGFDRGIILMVIYVGFAISVIALLIRRKLAVLYRGILLFFKGNIELIDRIDKIEKGVEGLHKEQIDRFKDYENELRKSCDQIETQVGNIEETILHSMKHHFADRFFCFDRMSSPVNIIHSHRPEESPHTREVEDERYVRPGIPKDEAEFVSFVYHWAMSSLSSIFLKTQRQPVQILCSCLVNEGDLHNNLIIVGDSTYNRVTQLIEVAAQERHWLHFHLEREPIYHGEEKLGERDIIAGVAGGPYAGKAYRPDPVRPEPTGGQLQKTYALLTRIPNPKSPRLDGSLSYAIIACGCHRAGQKALTEWLSRPLTLYKLNLEFGDQPFQTVISVEYYFSRDPELIEDSIREEIKTQLRIMP